MQDIKCNNNTLKKVESFNYVSTKISSNGKSKRKLQQEAVEL